MGKQLRKKGVIQGVVGISIGIVVWFVFGHKTLATVILSISSITAISAIFFTKTIYLRIHRIISTLSSLVGIAITYVFLAPLFFLFFLPFRLLFRRGSKDRMMRFTDKDIETYWMEYDNTPLKSQYERLY